MALTHCRSNLPCTGAASAASLDEQALALLLLLRSGATHQLIPKLAAYVANPSQAGGSVGWFSMYPSEAAQGLAGVALAAYDEARGSTKPDVELFADVNGLTVLEVGLVGSGRVWCHVLRVVRWARAHV